MYSPRIREDLIPLVHRAAKEGGVSMTAWVSQAVEEALSKAPERDGRDGRPRSPREPKPKEEAESHDPEIV